MENEVTNDISKKISQNVSVYVTYSNYSWNISINTYRVDAGQKSVTMSTDRMNSGAYNITLTEKGKKIDNARIIVK